MRITGTSKHEEALVARLTEDNAPDLLILNFLSQYRKLVEGHQGLIDESSIQAPDNITRLGSLPPTSERLPERLDQTVVLKLNGGLGTSMGLEKAKSLLPVKNGLCFLDIIANQLLHLRKETNTSIPLILMNSSHTDGDSLARLQQHEGLESAQDGLPFSFLQHRVPKINQKTLGPVDYPAYPEMTWCPPGHGDIYTALATTGLLEQLLCLGYNYAFISNADNLGATLDQQILEHVASENIPFLMEVTRRTEADRKGGHLAAYKDGQLLLREVAQCPKEQIDTFQDLQQYAYFNTNNLWVNLPALKDLLDKEGSMDLPVIFNRKTVNPTDPSSTPVIQMETAMGSAISLFEGARAIDVPRTRFAPVKTTNDLLALWSDAYMLTDAYHIKLHPDRQHVPPTIELDDRYYKLFPDFEKRFPKGAPSLLACESLSIEGDHFFEGGVTVTGSLSLSSRNTTRISSNTVLKEEA